MAVGPPMLPNMTHDHICQPIPYDPNERLLPRRELRRFVPVSDMTIWRWEAAGQFPHHLSINGRNYWLKSEIQTWLENQRGIGNAEVAHGQTA
jgi:predicted DNA-binding transcriptional regulator AlpA